MTQSPKNVSKGFTKAFWVSNTVELFERMAYYAVFIVLTIYLSSILGFNDLEASMISGLFSGGLYLLPIFTGAYADKIGFRKSMIVAFSLLSVGYLGLGILPTLLEAAGLVEYGKATRFTGLPDSDSRWMIVPVLFVIMVGGSFIKSIISASVAKETTEANRARGYSIFYMMVNIGAFTGKTVIDPLRNVIGEQAYIYINYFSATMTILALLSVVLLYKSTHTAGEGKSMREIGQGFLRIITNWRLLILILIITGFWMVQQQLYATMPKYVIRMAGETAKPGWIANVNPFVVVCCVSFVTRLMAKRSAITSMNIGMFLIPFSALLMAGLDGIQNKINPGDPADKNLYDLPPEENAKIPTVCSDLSEALAYLDQDREFLTRGGVFTNDLIDAYIAVKQEEVTTYRAAVHPLEYALYFAS